MIVAKLPIEDQARCVALMQALHDDDDGRRDRVVEARRHGFKKPVLSRLEDLLRGGVFDAQGIVDDHPIPTSTRDRPGCHGLPEARGGGLEFGLCVLIADHLHVRPQVLIPITLDQAAHADIVADGEVLAVGHADVAHVGHVLRPPFPRGPEDRSAQALHRIVNSDVGPSQ